jgi:hypothetical protein
MEGESEDDNWLNARTLACPRCETHLFAVDHSPFCDSHILYCDACPRRVEVGFYNPIYKELFAEVAGDGAEASQYAALMSAIERRLMPCDGVGHYKHDAQGRCYSCSSIIDICEPGVDLWPGFHNFNEDREPTEAEQALADEFMMKYVRTANIWR